MLLLTIQMDIDVCVLTFVAAKKKQRLVRQNMVLTRVLLAWGKSEG
jgi:hypothetical protein